MAARLTVISQQRVSDRAYEMLRDSILNRSLVPGQRLDVDSLARQMGISQMPVKQALDRLTTVGLVEVIPRKGSFVAEPSYQRVSEAFDVRIALELLAAEKIIPRLTTQRLNTLRKALRAFGQLEDADVQGHMQKNARFHTLIVDYAENRTLAEFYAQLGAHIQIASVHYRSDHWVRRRDQERAEHMAILGAMEAGDAERLTSVLRGHLDRAKQSLLDDIASSAVRPMLQHEAEG